MAVVVDPILMEVTCTCKGLDPLIFVQSITKSKRIYTVAEGFNFDNWIATVPEPGVAAMANEEPGLIQASVAQLLKADFKVKPAGMEIVIVGIVVET
jgi:hypothetical protein